MTTTHDTLVMAMDPDHAFIEAQAHYQNNGHTVVWIGKPEEQPVIAIPPGLHLYTVRVVFRWSARG